MQIQRRDCMVSCSWLHAGYVTLPACTPSLEGGQGTPFCRLVCSCPAPPQVPMLACAFCLSLASTEAVRLPTHPSLGGQAAAGEVPSGVVNPSVSMRPQYWISAASRTPRVGMPDAYHSIFTTGIRPQIVCQNIRDWSRSRKLWTPAAPPNSGSPSTR